MSQTQEAASARTKTPEAPPLCAYQHPSGARCLQGFVQVDVSAQHPAIQGAPIYIIELCPACERRRAERGDVRPQASR
jgi:hypothetical protein